MKKSLLIASVCMATILAGCTKTIPPASSEPATGAIDPLTSQYSYSRDMKIPSVKELTNRDSISQWYTETKKIVYKITQANIDDIKQVNDDYDNACKSQKIEVLGNGLPEEAIGAIDSKDFVLDKEITLNVPYTGKWLGLEFSKAQTETLNQQGWMVMEANSGMLAKIVWNNNYDPNSIEQSTPEWANYIDQLWGNTSPQQRYPYNTVYISTDLLLHSYHKLFANSLKEYEVTTAREKLSNIVSESLTTFSTLSKTATPQMKPYYDYLTAYRSIAQILLPSKTDMQKKVQAVETEYPLREDRQKKVTNWDITQEYLEEILKERAKTTITQYPTQYNTQVIESIDKIIEGKENTHVDILSQAFSPQTDPEFIIKQDYTQFVPRSHYTDNVELKTYFMSMKWLMRHKMYSRDPKSAQASLLMAKNFPTQAGQELQELQNFIYKMIGADDDTSLLDLQSFIKWKNITTDTDLVAQYTPSRTTELSALRPQKIISTSYNTPSDWSVTETEAKNSTNWFVFFWEKFTPDSWIMDQLTAWSAEQESKEKPPVISVYAIRDTIMWWSWNNYALTRLQKNISIYDITTEQINKYPVLKTDTHTWLAQNTDTSTIYNKWIALAQTAAIKPNNAPAYMKDNNFINKTLNTILGTYIELKHDTLLYVKQAYAEFGAAWDDECNISIDVPALPVPKWYVEPQIDVIDNILQLSQETNTFFGERHTTNFTLFNNYLTFLKTIAIAQTQNQVISDEDFEKLRLSYDTLSQIMSPSSTYTNNGEKWMRSALIADVFTSEFGPYYIANGRPLLMVVSIDDINGKRAVIWPVYSTYEFYGKPFASQAWRYSDTDRRTAYDTLTGKKELMTLPLQHILSE